MNDQYVQDEEIYCINLLSLPRFFPLQSTRRFFLQYWFQQSHQIIHSKGSSQSLLAARQLKGHNAPNSPAINSQNRTIPFGDSNSPSRSRAVVFFCCMNQFVLC